MAAKAQFPPAFDLSVKASARGKSIVNLLVSISQGGLSSIERMLYELDMSSLLPEKSVKIGSRSKKGRS
jgi:hypothetical protein